MIWVGRDGQKKVILLDIKPPKIQFYNLSINANDHKSKFIALFIMVILWYKFFKETFKMFNNENWSEDIKLKVWSKAQTDSANDAAVWRKDIAGAWINYNSYGNRSSDTNYGWEIDHIIPKSKGGSDNIDNLQALQWHNNCTKGDNYPRFETSISSEGTKNIYKQKSW